MGAVLAVALFAVSISPIFDLPTYEDGHSHFALSSTEEFLSEHPLEADTICDGSLIFHCGVAVANGIVEHSFNFAKSEPPLVEAELFSVLSEYLNLELRPPRV